MGQTLALGGAPSTGPLTSTDIVVGATPVSMFAYTGNAEFAYDFAAFVDRKVGANWIPEADYKGVTIVLNKARPGITAYAAGTYRLRKDDTVEAVGFGKDEV